MKQFVLEESPDNSGTVRLDGDDYHYLVRVRRLAAGERFPAVLPDGSETLIKVVSINNGVLTGKLEPVSPCDSTNHDSWNRLCNSLILFQALPKADKMDLIVRQAAESGVTEIVPFVSEFSVAKKNTGEQKVSRWERIIKEARQQSGSKIATKISRVLTLNELFEYWKKTNKEAIGLLFHHQKGVEQKSLHCYLNSVDTNIDTTVSKVVYAIGPEGGFSDMEVSLFLENGFKTSMIGDTILRTETAALYCTAAIKIVLLERDSWHLKK